MRGNDYKNENAFLKSNGIIEDDGKTESPVKKETNGPKTKNGIVARALHVKLRSTPKVEDGNTLEILRIGDRVTILGRRGEYYKVSTENNSVGYILSNFLKEE